MPCCASFAGAFMVHSRRTYSEWRRARIRARLCVNQMYVDAPYVYSGRAYRRLSRGGRTPREWIEPILNPPVTFTVLGLARLRRVDFTRS